MQIKGRPAGAKEDGYYVLPGTYYNGPNLLNNVTRRTLKIKHIYFRKTASKRFEVPREDFQILGVDWSSIFPKGDRSHT